jgi:parallel beta-helix repeat protein
MWPIAIWLYASEVVVQGNTIFSDHSGLWMGGLDEIIALPSMTLPDGTPLAEVFSSHECRNNVIGGSGDNEGNTITAAYGIAFSGHGSSSDSNEVLHNEIVANDSCIWSWTHAINQPWGTFPVTFNQNRIAGNRFDCGQSAINALGEDELPAIANLITDNVVTGSVEGIRLENWQNAEITDNQITGTLGHSVAGLMLQGSSDNNLIESNVVDGSVGHAFSFVDASNNLAIGNQVVRAETLLLNPDFNPRCWVDDTYLNGFEYLPLEQEGLAEFGSALMFDGFRTKVEVPHEPHDTELSFDDQAITVAVWVKPAVDSFGWRTIISKLPELGAHEYSGRIYLVLLDNKVWIQLGNPDFIDPLVTNTIIEGGQWSHLAFTFSAEEDALKLMVNGLQVEEFNGMFGDGFNFLHNEEPMYLGYNTWWPNETFDGLMDDVAVWDSALSVEEIAALASGGHPDVSDQRLVANYDGSMNGDCGDAALFFQDHSMYENHGLTKCISCPHLENPEDGAMYLASASLFLDSKSLSNVFKGAFQDSVIDEPGFSPIIYYWQEGDTDLSEPEYVGSAGYLDNDKSKPNIFDYSEIFGYWWDGEDWHGPEQFPLPVGIIPDGKRNCITGFDKSIGKCIERE